MQNIENGALIKQSRTEKEFCLGNCTLLKLGMNCKEHRSKRIKNWDWVYVDRLKNCAVLQAGEGRRATDLPELSTLFSVSFRKRNPLIFNSKCLSLGSFIYSVKPWNRLFSELYIIVCTELLSNKLKNNYGWHTNILAYTKAF